MNSWHFVLAVYSLLDTLYLRVPKRTKQLLRLQLLAYSALLFILVHLQVNFLVKQPFIYYSCLSILLLIDLLRYCITRHLVQGFLNYSLSFVTGDSEIHYLKALCFYFFEEIDKL